MRLFCHLVYEYKKGVRNLLLYTTNITELHYIFNKLNKEKIPFILQRVNSEKINIYFGNPKYLKVIENFIYKNLNELSSEEDFMLGILLGYSIEKQVDRYIKKSTKNNSIKQIHMGAFYENKDVRDVSWRAC